MFLSRRRGFTLMELMIVMVVIGILIAMLVPALSGVMENSRATQCKNNLNQIGLALIDGADQMSASMFFIDDTDPNNIKKVLSASKMPEEVDLGSLQPGQQGIGSTGTPYSFYVRLLPYLGKADISQDFDWDVGPFDVGTKDTSLPVEDQWGGNVGLGATIIPLLRCPSFSGPEQSESDVYSTAEERPALAQYKAVGGSTLDVMLNRSECLSSDGEGGVIHPWKEAAIMKLKDAEQTAILFETREENLAAWIDGVYASIPGIIPDPDGGGGTGPTAGMVGLNIGPTGDPQDTTPPYLSDSSKVEDGSGGTGTSTSTRLGTEDMNWGPSSEHREVVHHLMGNRVVRAVIPDIEIRAYRALLTRNPRDNRQIGDVFKSK